MNTTDMVHVRVERTTKVQATEALAAMGLSVSDAVRAFLVRVAVEKELPFTLRVPNAETAAALKEAQAIRVGRFENAQDLMNALDTEAR